MVWQRVMTIATRGYQARAAGTDDPGVWSAEQVLGPRPSLYPAIPKEPRERSGCRFFIRAGQSCGRDSRQRTVLQQVEQPELLTSRPSQADFIPAAYRAVHSFPLASTGEPRRRRRGDRVQRRGELRVDGAWAAVEQPQRGHRLIGRLRVASSRPTEVVSTPEPGRCWRIGAAWTPRSAAGSPRTT
jgi:hypothetical protein